ncbi:hypothetical protein [Paenarthrobacter nicotinovorans]|uniref:hypothetical protein n=1 Tax=Paenarthrobacter nicotinovorans TaxID=29320 RepID=UPI0009A7D95C|nr:hypothetical protein [Paenarthrobacter nicotinovorans]MDI2020659.1 hypothetical protein [Paenarthrobacter nicotinovorans]SKB94854.1 hypothetical protein SAMN05660916_03504 [Arthrobacter sp. 31Cvi3.1E]
MSQDEHRVDPDSEPGGYGTPTPEQEMPGSGDGRETPERPAEGVPEVPGDEFPTPKDPDAAPPSEATGQELEGG